MADNFWKNRNGIQLGSNSSAPANPKNGDMYYDTTLGTFQRYQNGSWGPFGSGGGGTGKNYLSAIRTSQSSTPNTGNGDFETNSTTGFSLAHSALTSNFPSTVGSAGSSFSSAGGAHGGSAANGNLSLSVVSSGQLAGGYSASYASSAATTAGDMVISDAFNIDTEDQAKVLTFKVYYKAQSGAANGNFSGTSSNSFGFAIYDVTNAAWIMPAGVWNVVQNSGVGYATGTFQATSNSTQYQIAMFNANASTGAITMYIDDISVGPQTAPTGPAMTDWIAYTPTGSWNTNTNYAGYYRRNGDSIDLQIQVNLTGAPNNVTLTVNLPSGIAVDSTKQIAQNANEMWGTVKGVAGGNGFFGSTQLSGNAVLPVFVKDGNTASIMTVAGISATAPYTFANTDFITITAMGIPVTGWSSNTSMSSDTDTRVVAVNGIFQTPTGTLNGSFNVVKFAANKDTHGGYNASTGLYTVPVTGFYQCSATLDVSATFTAGQFVAVQIARNAGAADALYGYTKSYGSVTADFAASTSGTIFCNAGDTLGVYSALTGTGSPAFSIGTAGNFFEFTRVSGPSVVAATETVAAAYTNVTQSGAVATSLAAVTWVNKVLDTHNAMSSGTYTIPAAGVYSIYASVEAATTVTNPHQLEIVVLQNGSVKRGGLIYTETTTASRALNAQVSCLLRCNAGDTITVQAVAPFGQMNWVQDDNFDYFEIKRIGL